MTFSLVSYSFLLLLTVILVGYFAIVGTGRRARIQRQGGGILAALRTAFSAPAFLVPTAMAGAGIFALTVSSRNGGQNPWISDDEGVLPQCAAIVIVALCLAGHVGLLEARRDGRVAESEDFVQGIRKHGWTFLVAKFAWAAAVLIPFGGHWSRWEYRQLELDSLGSLWFVAMFLVPSVLLAPVLTTASFHPRSPIRALSASVVFALRNPWAVTRIVLVQAGLAALCLRMIQAGSQPVAFALTNGSPLGFQLYAYIPVAYRLDDGDACAFVLMALTAPVFLGAYWALGNGDLVPAARQRRLGAAGSVERS